MIPIAPKNSEISIVIGIKYSHEIIDFMLQNRIPFSMSTIYETAPSIPNQDQTVSNQYFAANQQNDTPKPTNIFEAVYQKHIIDNLEKDKLPEVDEIAKELGIGVQSFKKKFQKEYNKTFYQAYLEKKMEYATELLKKGLTATAISNRIGYSHPIKFNKMFQKHFGMTPKKYQMMYRKK